MDTVVTYVTIPITQSEVFNYFFTMTVAFGVFYWGVAAMFKVVSRS